MFFTNESQNARPEFKLEPLDARRLLSVSVGAEEVIAEPSDVAAETVEILLAEETSEYVEDSGEIIELMIDETGSEEDFIRYTMLETSVDDSEVVVEDDVLMYKDPVEGEEVIYYTLENDMIDEVYEYDPDAEIYYNLPPEASYRGNEVIDPIDGWIAATGGPVASGEEAALPPPPSQASGLAGSRDLFESILGSDDNVLA